MSRSAVALGIALRIGVCHLGWVASGCNSPASPGSQGSRVSAGSQGSESPGATAVAQAAPAPEHRPSDSGAPRVVVAVIYDQLGSNTLLANLSALDPRGALRRAIDSGVYLERSVYPYANTLTAPGHATVHTGAPPLLSGIEGNSIWDTARGAVAVTDDPRRLAFGREADNVGASPTRLRVPTVAHALRAATRGAGKIISLSIKDRSAILSVGTAADLVLWYDSKLGAFTSSNVWGPALPGWLTRYQVEHPIRALLVPWVAEKPDEYLTRLGPDDARGEGDLGGFGTVFPHRFDSVQNPLAVLPLTPMLSEYLVGLTEAAARELHLGEDDVPDLIALSISGTDGAGHVFGPGSWEYTDHLIRADRAVGAWLARLERVAPIAVLITSDHGVAPLPETRDGAGRLYPERLRVSIEAALATHFGAGPWVAGVLTPFVYLTDRARLHPERAKLVDVARAALLRERGVRDAWTLERVRAFGDSDPIERALRLSVAPDNEAALMFLAQPYHPLDLRDPPDRGTNHGTPYDYDRQVPVLAFGASVPRKRSAEPVDQLRVAATLARLLRVPEPAAAAKGSLF
jgi:Type I phosphodiesterase / nucleotide pyrophosphatase